MKRYVCVISKFRVFEVKNFTTHNPTVPNDKHWVCECWGTNYRWRLTGSIHPCVWCQFMASVWIFGCRELLFCLWVSDNKQATSKLRQKLEFNFTQVSSSYQYAAADFIQFLWYFFFSTFCYEATFTCNTHHKGESDCLWHHFKSFKVLFMNIRALVLRFCLVYVRFIQDYLCNRVSEPSVCSIIYSFIILIALQGSSTF